MIRARTPRIAWQASASGPVTAGTTEPIAAPSTSSCFTFCARSSPSTSSAELVRGARRVGGDAPVRAQLLAGEEADRRLGVADIECQDHADSSSRTSEPLRQGTVPCGGGDEQAPVRIDPGDGAGDRLAAAAAAREIARGELRRARAR